MKFKSNKPVMKISSSSLKKNLRLFKRLSGDASIGCVLKSNAYGCDLELISNFFYNNGIKIFFVATHNEAQELSSYIKKNIKIYVIADFWKPSYTFQKSKIISTASTYQDLIKLELIVRKKNISPLAIHLDFGLNRYGIQCNSKVHDIFKTIERNGHKDILIIAHLSHADNCNSEINDTQYENLIEFRNKFKKFRYSLSGSAGVINNSNFSLDIIRPGISLFGATSTNSPRMKDFKNVVSLEAPILQIKIIKKGEGVGYGHKFIANKKSYIATAKIGYADGLNRRLSKKSLKIFFNGKSFDLVGRISMDLITFKIDKKTYDYVLNNSKKTHYVELINDIQNPTYISNILDTIPHEILTSISERVDRKIVK